MAWEDFSHEDRIGMTGDKPIDEFALALRKIAEAYQSRFSRKPTSVELAYALEQVIGADPEAYVSDAEGLDDVRVKIER
jgi:hypothetical protein